jgi:arsenate reductase
MAEGIVRARYGDRYDAYSAGIYPAGVDPWAVKVMEESGVDISGHRSKMLDIFSEHLFDYLVVMSDSPNDIPGLPHADRYLSCGIPDPAAGGAGREETLGRYRTTRDRIDEWIRNFFD